MKKFLKHIIYGLFFFVLINLLVYIKYEYPAYQAIKNKTHKNYLKWNSIQKNKDNFDLILLGSSRVYTGFNPKIIDSSLNIKSINMGSSAQDIAESYHALVEILNYQNPKHVVLEAFFDLSDNTHDYYQIFSNASFFNSSKNKFNLIVNGFGGNGIANYFIPLMKFGNYMKQDIMSLLSNKQEKIAEINWYKGYLKVNKVISKTQIKTLKPIANYNNTMFNKKRFETYFNKIHKLTTDKGIKLIVLRTPYPPSRLKLNSNNDEGMFYKAYISTFKNVTFFDLNLYKSGVFKYKDEDFYDHHHTNHVGAYKLSQQLIDIIKNQ